MTATPVMFGKDVSGTTAARPTHTADVGQPYWDTTLGTFVIWSGTAWSSPCVELQGLTPGTAAANKAMVLGASGQINGITTIGVDELTVASLTASALAVTWMATIVVASVSGQLLVTGNVDFTTLPTHDPGSAGRVWRNGHQLMVSTG